MVDVSLGIRPSNGYSFHCPVVDRTTRFMACEFIRHRHWRGERVASAPDCQCAMRASKCPALVMLRLQWAGDYDFFDTEVKVHSLLPEVAEAVEKLIIIPSHAEGLDLSPEQRNRLLKNDLGKISVSAGAASKGSPKSAAAAKGKGKTSRKVTDASTTAGLDHIMDTVEQINQAMENQSDAE